MKRLRTSFVHRAGDVTVTNTIVSIIHYINTVCCCTHARVLSVCFYKKVWSVPRGEYKRRGRFSRHKIPVDIRSRIRSLTLYRKCYQ